MNKSPHKNLEAWKNAMLLVEQVYKLTLDFPNEEKFGLVSQMRRAAVSVPSNLAEGAANRTKNQFVHFLSISLGSLAELDTQIELCKNLGYINDDSFQQIIIHLDKTKALVFGLRKSLEKNEK
ncbi:four helix bundle protein [Flavobacterium sp.]|uniref:four helix bundle protein n=1 Tax=Flavobacterium sp. TaxID=239 RepID=UPI004047F28D